MSESELKVQVLEGPDNKLDLAKLEDVFRRKLVIPSYQRPYTWTLEDINEIFQTLDDMQENIYFFGSIILSKKGNSENGFGQEEYYIIDGQQRLSSFLLILKVILDQLNHLFKELKSKTDLEESQVEKKIELKVKKEEIAKIIETVSLKRDGQSLDDEEKSILDFIKKDVGDYNSLPSHLIEKIKKISSNDKPILYINNLPDSKDKKFFQYIESILKFVHFILNKIKFCLICITGKDSEDFAISLFNTLNTTGQPLTAFEVLKSELHIIDLKLSEEINKIQSKIIRQYAFERKKIVTHTGKLLLYLALYRGDFKENSYTLSDKQFKNQRGYLKEILEKKDKTYTSQIVKDIKNINDFYSNNWLNLDLSKKNAKELKLEDDEQVCFIFLSELKHDRVLPIIIRFYYNNREFMGKCIKLCTAFSSLWRAFHNGGTSGIDKAYKDVSSGLKNNYEIEDLKKKLKTLFFDKLSLEKRSKEGAKRLWLQQMKKSTIYKNQKLSKLLLFLAYNKKHFDTGTNSLKKRGGVDILTSHYWQHDDYKTIEHIIPKSNEKVSGSHINTIGNLTLLPKALNSSLGDKKFPKKLKEYKRFCSKENEDGDEYPYLPIIKHIAHYDQFGEKQIEERSEILSKFIWNTLVEDWLGWR